MRIDTIRMEFNTWEGVSIHEITGALTTWLSGAGVGTGLCILSLPDEECVFAVTDDLDGTYDDLIRVGRDRLAPPPGKAMGSDRLDDAPDDSYLNAVVATSLTIPVRGARVAVGAWSSVVLIDPAGPARRAIDVTVVGE
jgi:thiamine phosphate synthase YjbQ (UPF0047 family)